MGVALYYTPIVSYEIGSTAHKERLNYQNSSLQGLVVRATFRPLLLQLIPLMGIFYLRVNSPKGKCNVLIHQTFTPLNQDIEHMKAYRSATTQSLRSLMLNMGLYEPLDLNQHSWGREMHEDCLRHAKNNLEKLDANDLVAVAHIIDLLNEFESVHDLLIEIRGYRTAVLARLGFND